MVKRFLSFCLLLALGTVRADYIWWCADDTDYGGSYTAARVRATTDGTYENAETLAVVLFDESQYAYIESYPDGIAPLTDLNDPPSTGNMWSQIAPGLDLAATSFFIELGNYTEGLNGELNWTATVVQSEMRDYVWLDTNGAIGHDGQEVSGAWRPWHGTYAVPEPTGGLLVAVGFALCALRRRGRIDARRKDGGK